jgi:alpha-beta hydrolase superfamily lysophospholipase
MGNMQDYLTLKDGTKIYYQVREIDAPCWLIATHGIGEHLGRHDYLDDVLGERFNIFRYDLRGHGQSGGERGKIDDFSRFYQDLEEILAFLRDKFRMQDYVLFGHSMGALITAGTLQKRKEVDNHLRFVYLSSPPVGIGGGLGEIVRLIPGEIFGKLARFKKGVMLPGMVNLKYLSTDQSVAEKFNEDPHTLKFLHSTLLLALVAASKEVFAKPLRIHCPAVCSVGSDDKIVSVSELINFFTLIDKSVKVKVFTGARHEIHNEIKSLREEYFSFLRSQLVHSLAQ